jgi:hypothetical protein
VKHDKKNASVESFETPLEREREGERVCKKIHNRIKIKKPQLSPWLLRALL